MKPYAPPRCPPRRASTRWDEDGTREDFDTLLRDPASSESSFFALRGRLGILPFKSDFESLQIWTVLQVDAQSWSESPIELTPLLRLFYKNVLWEMGSSMSGKTWLHMMVHL